MRNTILLIGTPQFSFLAVAQQNKGKEVELSSLLAAPQAEISAAVRRWNAQAKWKTAGDTQDLSGDSLVESVRLGPHQKPIFW